MKILHIIDSSGIYGAEMVLLNLMEEQVQMGLAPFLGSIGELNDVEKPLEVEALRRGLKVIKFRMRKGYSLAGALQMVRYAVGQKIDLSHSHGYKSNILLGSLPRWLRKMPVISTLHGWTSTKIISKIWFYNCLDKLCLRRLDAVVSVNSLPSGSRNLRILKGIRMYVVENGIPSLSFDVDAVLRNDCAIAKFCENAFVIGSIGRLSVEKGWFHLIEVMHFLVMKGDNYKAIIIGEGPQRVELEKMLEEMGLSGRVLLAGYRENAFQYLPVFDVFVLPSLTEGLPVTLLEAMQAGVPIVATRVGGVPETLGNGRCGVIVEPKDAKALADAVLYLRKNPVVAHEMAKRAREVALTRYSSRRMAEEYSKIYETVLGN